MENRETKILQTPLGKDVELKTYLTAGENKKLRAISLGDSKIQADGVIEGGMNVDQLDKFEEVMIDIMVVNYDGSAENIKERLTDLPSQEQEFIAAEILKIKKGNLEKAK